MLSIIITIITKKKMIITPIMITKIIPIVDALVATILSEFTIFILLPEKRDRYVEEDPLNDALREELLCKAAPCIAA